MFYAVVDRSKCKSINKRETLQILAIESVAEQVGFLSSGERSQPQPITADGRQDTLKADPTMTGFGHRQAVVRSEVTLRMHKPWRPLALCFFEFAFICIVTNDSRRWASKSSHVAHDACMSSSATRTQLYIRPLSSSIPGLRLNCCS